MFSSYSIFKEDEFVKFKQAIKQYCNEQKYSEMNLSDDEITQLSWYMDSYSVTPEARGQDILDKFHFEIKRGLARRYSFELILRGDVFAYDEFTKAQNKNTILEVSSFKQLSEEARLFDEAKKAAIRAGCFLTISDKAKEILKKNNIILSNDSEEFLSQLSVELIKNRLLFPLTQNLTDEQLNIIQKMFWPNMHLRHMLYTEGGDSMTKTFVDGILNGTFNEQDFLAWKWRWLTNLFGFQGGPGAKYYNAETHLLVSIIIKELDNTLGQPSHSYLDSYLLKRAEMAGFNKEELCLTTVEQKFLGHLAAYYHQISILTATEGNALYEGYIAFKKEFKDAEVLAKLYDDHRKDMLTITPTYVPAVINNAYLIFKNKFRMDTSEALKNSSLFMCQLLHKLYSLPHDKRISCMTLAKEPNLQRILENWISNHHAYEFELNENFELTEKEIPEFKLAESIVLT
jgi:hypothetical protein